MIFHTRHRHSVIDLLSSKSLVCVEYQMQGFHGNQALWQTSCYVNKHNDFDRRGQYFYQKFVLVKKYAAKRLINEHFSPLCIHLRVNLVCIKSFYQQDNE